jgi:hypothetical protein
MTDMWSLNIWRHSSSVKKASGCPASPNMPLLSTFNADPRAVELHFTYYTQEWRFKKASRRLRSCSSTSSPSRCHRQQNICWKLTDTWVFEVIRIWVLAILYSSNLREHLPARIMWRAACDSVEHHVLVQFSTGSVKGRRGKANPASKAAFNDLDALLLLSNFPSLDLKSRSSDTPMPNDHNHWLMPLERCASAAWRGDCVGFRV